MDELGRLPLRVFLIGKYAFQKNAVLVLLVACKRRAGVIRACQCPSASQDGSSNPEATGDLFLETIFIDQATRNGTRPDSPLGVKPARLRAICRALGKDCLIVIYDTTKVQSTSTVAFPARMLRTADRSPQRSYLHCSPATEGWYHWVVQKLGSKIIFQSGNVA